MLGQAHFKPSSACFSSAAVSGGEASIDDR